MHLVRGKLSLKSGLKGVPVNNPLAYEARIKVNEKITSLLGGNFSSYNLAIRRFEQQGLFDYSSCCSRISRETFDFEKRSEFWTSCTYGKV